MALNPRLQGLLPACVLHAILITWLNGWSTSRRFQQRPVGPCRYSSACIGSDDLEHYSCCPFLWSSAPWAPTAGRERSLREFLLLGPVPHATDDDLKAHGYWIFAAYGAFNFARARQQVLPPEHLFRVLAERFAFARRRPTA